MEPPNQRALLPLLRRFRERFPQKNIWCYTGYTYERDLLDPQGKARCDATDEFLSYIDILVDGEFDQELYDISLKFRGSRNQRILQIHEEGCPPIGNQALLHLFRQRLFFGKEKAFHMHI